MFAILKFWIFTLLTSIFVVFSREAYSCAACGFGFDATRNAFLWTTLIMSAVPLMAIGGLVYFLVKRIQAEKLKQTSVVKSK